MSQTKVEAPFVEGGGGSNFKNLMINGDMGIAQRASSVSSHSTTDYVNIDRWETRVFNQGVFTVSQSTTVPAGEGFASSQKWDCTTADGSPAASDFLIFEQKMEGQNLQHLEYGTSSAKKLTVSFHVRSNKTGAYTVGLYSADGSRHIESSYTISSADTWEKKIITFAGGSRHIESSYTISSADTWEKKIITFAGDTGGTINDDNGEGMKLWFWLGAGSNFSSGTHATSWAAYSQANVLVDNQVNMADSTDNEWYITGVQLETGDDASEFEHLPHDVSLARCQRYCLDLIGGDYSYIAQGNFSTATYFHFTYYFPVEMRAAPSSESTDSDGTYRVYSNGGYDIIDEVHVVHGSSRQATIRNNTDLASGGHSTATNNTSGHGAGLYVLSASTILRLTAEL